jgi:hypothetical protein
MEDRKLGSSLVMVLRSLLLAAGIAVVGLDNAYAYIDPGYRQYFVAGIARRYREPGVLQELPG